MTVQVREHHTKKPNALANARDMGRRLHHDPRVGLFASRALMHVP